MKIPEPIIEPITSVVASKRRRLLTSSAEPASVVGAGVAISLEVLRPPSPPGPLAQELGHCAIGSFFNQPMTRFLGRGWRTAPGEGLLNNSISARLRRPLT